MPRKRKNIIVQRYDSARKEYPDLDEESFLKFIAPGRTFRNPKTTIANLRSGKTTGARIIEAAKEDAGRTVSARYVVGKLPDGSEDIRGQNIRLPMSKSRLDLFRPGVLKKAVNKGLAGTFAMRNKEQEADEGAEKYQPIRVLPEGATLHDLARNANPHRPAQVIR